MGSRLTTAKLAYEDGDRLAFGYATTTVRARPIEVLAYLWELKARRYRKRNHLERSVDPSSDHNQVLYLKVASPGLSLQDRDFLTRFIWRARGTGFWLVSCPTTSPAHPLLKNVVRATYPSAYKIIDAGSGFTKLEYVLELNRGSQPIPPLTPFLHSYPFSRRYVIHPDAGGVIPAIVMRQIMGSNLEHVSHVRGHLQALRGLQDWDAKDGEAVGEVLVTKTDAEEHHKKGGTKVEARVRAMMETHVGLRELGDKHEWFEVLLTKVVANKLRPAGDSKAKLCNMSEKEATVIGGALASCIAANLTAPAAVDEWILRYPAMGELER
jgi:hypothetical protein